MNNYLKMAALVAIALTFSTISARNLNAADVPDKSELKKMAVETLTSFGEALKGKDFSSFYEDIASLWKKQTTPEKLMESFKSMAGPNFDILGIVKELKPTFDPPAEVNSDGVLIVRGYYPTKPNHVVFQLKYIEEEEEWKLVGINVKTEEAASKEEK
jgi:hypothetical protein